MYLYSQSHLNLSENGCGTFMGLLKIFKLRGKNKPGESSCLWKSIFQAAMNRRTENLHRHSSLTVPPVIGVLPTSSSLFWPRFLPTLCVMVKDWIVPQYWELNRNFCMPPYSFFSTTTCLEGWSLADHLPMKGTPFQDPGFDCPKHILEDRAPVLLLLLLLNPSESCWANHFSLLQQPIVCLFVF